MEDLGQPTFCLSPKVHLFELEFEKVSSSAGKFQDWLRKAKNRPSFHVPGEQAVMHKRKDLEAWNKDQLWKKLGGIRKFGLS